MNDKENELADLLQRDADRVRNHIAFDARLHQDTMRRIRQLEPAMAASGTSGWARLTVTAAAAFSAAACVFLLLAPPERAHPPQPTTATVDSKILPRPISPLAYRRAFADGEAALLAMLDRDARVLLPQSPSVFRSLP